VNDLAAMLSAGVVILALLALAAYLRR